MTTETRTAKKLVEELRGVPHAHHYFRNVPSALLDQAADEIERLERELKHWMAFWAEKYAALRTAAETGACRICNGSGWTETPDIYTDGSMATSRRCPKGCPAPETDAVPSDIEDRCKAAFDRWWHALSEQPRNTYEIFVAGYGSRFFEERPAAEPTDSLRVFYAHAPPVVYLIGAANEAEALQRLRAGGQSAVEDDIRPFGGRALIAFNAIEQPHVLYNECAWCGGSERAAVVSPGLWYCCDDCRQQAVKRRAVTPDGERK